MYLDFLFLLLFLGTLGWFGFLFNLGLLSLERSKKLREQARALGTVFLLRCVNVSGLQVDQFVDVDGERK